ncbi:MAG: amino acid adenylation domain-containing protein, partial [Candidatus Aminicenantes bacterium]
MKKKNIEDILALTPMQEGLLFHYLQDRQGESYFNQLNLEVSGEIDLEYFEKSWNLVIETNEILRTVFRWEKLEKPTQVVLEKHTIHLKYKDLAIIGDSEDKRKQWETIKQQDRNNPFDLQEVPFRVTLGKITQNQHHILISYHHILFDGWSIGIILKEFFQAYETLVKGSQSLVPPVKPRFKEFIRWHQEQDPKEQKKFWQNYLEGFETPTQLPVKQLKPGPGIQSKRNYRLHLPEMIKDKLEVFVKEKRLSLATFFYSAWGVLLQKYCCMEDVVFGTVVSGRSAPIRGIEDMVGLLINTIPHRARLEPGDTLLDFLVRINNHLAAVGKYENIPLVDIHSYSQRPNQVGEELFDTIVAVENYPLDTYLKNLGSHLSIQSYEMEERPHYDLTLVISAAGGIDIDFIYNNTCFDKETIVRLAHHFGTILKGIGENVENRPQEIEILSGEEKHQLLVDFNRTAAAYPGEKAIHELFEEQVERTSDNIAVIGPLEMEYRTYMVYISYQELNEKSNRLAHLLRSKGVQSDTIVSIMLERSLEMVIGILGIFKAGGGYLPIAVDYPQERIQYMLTDSRSKILLTNHEEIGKWNWVNEKIVNCQLYSPLERGASSVGINGGGGVCQNLHLPPAPATAVSSLTLTSTSTCQVSPANLAYVIYTSGSTGKPKGVMVEHGPVVNLLFALQHRYPLREQDTYLLKTSYLFDVSVTELFGWFLEGGRLAILQPGGEKDPKAIREMIAREGVTHINFVPSMFRTFVEILDPQEIVKLAGLKYIFLAGEALLPGPVNRFRRLNTAIAIENIYGPTEAAVYAGWYSLADWKGEASIPIGKPLPNVTLYIVDKWGYLQPIGVPGELRIGGKGLARGYLNRPELTADKFDHDLWDYQDYQDGYHRSSRSYKSYVLYKTGDLARWLPDGNIEFLGRMDHQVKIRGFRIELGEIEHRLFKHDEIKEAVVVPIADARGDRYLCAYIAGSKEFDTSELREFLSAQLPDYMVPSHFVQLEAIPLTSNGKINRKILPSPG